VKPCVNVGNGGTPTRVRESAGSAGLVFQFINTKSFFVAVEPVGMGAKAAFLAFEGIP